MLIVWIQREVNTCIFSNVNDSGFYQVTIIFCLYECLCRNSTACQGILLDWIWYWTFLLWLLYICCYSLNSGGISKLYSGNMNWKVSVCNSKSGKFDLHKYHLSLEERNFIMDFSNLIWLTNKNKANDETLPWKLTFLIPTQFESLLFLIDLYCAKQKSLKWVFLEF